MRKTAYSVERIAYSVERLACSKVLSAIRYLLSAIKSAIRYPLSAKINIFLFLLCGLWFMAPPVEAAERFFEIKAKKFSYTPNIITVNRGDTVKIRLLSEDVHHGFFLDGYGIKTSAHPGMEGSLKFIADKAGRYTFRCSVTCGEFHPYMVGYLVVGPNSRFWLFAAIVLAIGMGSIITLNRARKTNG